eukprot:3701069-Prymnesium_polylepis.2
MKESKPSRSSALLAALSFAEMPRPERKVGVGIPRHRDAQSSGRRSARLALHLANWHGGGVPSGLRFDAGPIHVRSTRKAPVLMCFHTGRP